MTTLRYILPERFLITALALPPQAPTCPDYGFPSLPSSADRCAEPWIEVYDAPCTAETIQCLLFRKPAYEWRQHRLAGVLARRPDDAASAEGKYDWCVEVLELLAQLADDTNVSHRFLSGGDVPSHLTRTRALLESLRPMLNGTPVPIMFPEVWRTGTGSEAIPPRHSALGFHVLSLLSSERVTPARGAYLWQPVSPQHRKAIAGQVSLEAPRPVRRGLADRELSARALTLDIFREAPGAHDFLVARVERPTGRAPCLFVGPFDRECWNYERFSVAIAGAGVTMDLLEAAAHDWIAADFNRLVDQGFIRYATYLTPYAERGQLAMDADELREHIITTTRRQAQGAVGAVGGVVGAVAAAVPVVGAVVAVVAAVLALVLEFAPIAYGGGGCPALGFRRMLTDTDCAVPNPQGNPNVAALLAEYRNDVVQPSSTPTAPTPLPVTDPVDADTGGSPWPWLGVAAGATALLLGGLALSRRRQGPSGEEEST
ncbi:MAG: hypothetical protein AB8I08_33010 [Sandaracinaceae bacterium]